MSEPIAHHEHRMPKMVGLVVSGFLATAFGFVAARQVDGSRLVQRNRPWVEAWTQELARATALPEFASATEESNSTTDPNRQAQGSSKHSALDRP